jgi:hypothetical protein
MGKFIYFHILIIIRVYLVRSRGLLVDNSRCTACSLA